MGEPWKRGYVVCMYSFVPSLYPAFCCSTRNEAVCVCVQSYVAAFSIYTYCYLSLLHMCLPIPSPLPHTGGSVTAGLGIYDTMQYIQPPVATWCVGQACSMGAFLLAAGAWGMRHCLPHSRVMIHQPHGTAGVREILRVAWGGI